MTLLVPFCTKRLAILGLKRKIDIYTVTEQYARGLTF